MKPLVACVPCFILGFGALADAAGATEAAEVPPCLNPIKPERNGKLRSCQTSQDFQIDDIHIPKGSNITFEPHGEVGQASLGAESRVYGQLLPQGTVLFMSSRGHLRHFWLPKDTLIQGHLLRGQDDGAGNRLHPNGKVLLDAKKLYEW